MTTTPAPQLLQRVNNRGGDNSKEGTSESAMDENSGECDEEEYDQGIRSNSNDKDKWGTADDSEEENEQDGGDNCNTVTAEYTVTPKTIAMFCFFWVCVKLHMIG